MSTEHSWKRKEESTPDIVNTKSKCNFTALTMAVKGGDTETVRILLSKGADPNMNMTGYDGTTALTESLQTTSLCSNERASMIFQKITKMLISSGADVNLEDNYLDKHGQIPLMVAIRWAEKLREDVMLVEAGADLDIKDRDGFTALMNASMTMISTMSKKYYFPGRCPFKTSKPCESIVKFLMDKGADISIQNNEGQTALMMLL